MTNTKNNLQYGIEIDIKRMLEAKTELQKHVQKNRKDEAPKIKLKKNAAKIKKLIKLLEEKKDPLKRSLSKITKNYPVTHKSKVAHKSKR